MPGSSVIAEAIRYVLTRWDGLVLFVDDGHIELDTNPVERAMRPIALNRRTRSSPDPKTAPSTGPSSRP